MHHFPCTPDCPLEIYADWLEDQGIDPAEIRLMAMGWISPGYGNGYICGNGYGYGYGDGDGDGYGNGYGNAYGYGYGYGHGYGTGNGF